MIDKITSLIANPDRDFIYKILNDMKLSLCVDIGAAAGGHTQKICNAGDDKTKIVAFEPFPGNFTYFQETSANLKNDISLIKKAVSNKTGTAQFIVSSVVQGNEPNWQDYKGYSSVGFLSTYSPITTFLLSKFSNLYGSLLKRQPPKVLEVDTTTVDEEFPNEVIDYLKIDVQGAEEEVLLGAIKALKDNRIHVLYIEWTGEEEIVGILSDCGYKIYDSTYIAVPKTPDKNPYIDAGFDYAGEVNLSTGQISYELILRNKDIDPLSAIKNVQQRNLGYIQTDLIAVCPQKIQEFLSAAQKIN